MNIRVRDYLTIEEAQSGLYSTLVEEACDADLSGRQEALGCGSIHALGSVWVLLERCCLCGSICQPSHRCGIA